MKRKYELMYWVIAGLMLSGNSLYAQALTDLQNRFSIYAQAAPQEKIFVHTDKEFYLAGEVLWFKVYNVNAVDNHLLGASKVAYVELLDKNNNPVLQSKVGLAQGQGSGSLYLPVSVFSGNYKLRAYTNWMKNFGAENYFEKNISVVNSLRDISFESPKTAATYTAAIYAEGGNLVSGLENRMTISIQAADGHGPGYTGAIVNDKNDTVVRFASYKFGMSGFLLKPEAGSNYRAVVKFANGQSASYPFGAMEKGGFTLHLTNADAGKVKVSVHSLNYSGTLYLMAHNLQNIAVALQQTMTNGEASFLIDKSRLPDGVSQITLFNDARQPIAERTYIKKPAGGQLNIEASASAAGYASRKKVDVSIATKNEADASNLSLAVYKVDSLNNGHPQSIFSYLWLNANLSGNIEEPDYYVNNDDEVALDNLALSNGFSRYKKDDTWSGSRPAFKFLPEYEGHLITGKVTNPATPAPAANELVLLTVPGKHVQLYNALTHAGGNFSIGTKNFFGQNEVIAMPRNEQDSLFKIQIDNPFSTDYNVKRLPEFTLSSNLHNALAAHNLAMQAQNLYTGNQLRQQYMPAIDTSATFNGLQKQYLLDDYTRFATMEEVLRENIHEVLVSKQRDQFRFRVLNNDYYMGGNQPLVLYDGVPMYNFNKVIAADPLKVRKIDVIPAQYYLGPETEYGVISMTTYKGDMGGVEINPHALVLDYEGLQLQRSFFSPVYETESQASSHLPDLRTTLYWLPNLDVGGDGKVSVSFYTSDETGKYIGVVQGISQSGKSGMQVFKFEVK